MPANLQHIPRSTKKLAILRHMAAENEYDKPSVNRFWVTEEGFGLNDQIFTEPFSVDELSEFFGSKPSILPGPYGQFVYARWPISNIEAVIDLTLERGPQVYSLSWRPKNMAYWTDGATELQYDFMPILRDKKVCDDDGKISAEVLERSFFDVKRSEGKARWNCNRNSEAAKGRVYAYADIGSDEQLNGFHAYIKPKTRPGNVLGDMFHEGESHAFSPDYSIEMRDRNSYRKGFQTEVGEQLAKLTVGIVRAIVTTVVVLAVAWWMLNKFIPIGEVLESLTQ